MYTGPFIVIEQTGPVNYRLQKTKNSKPFVAHVDKLRPSYTEGCDDVGGATAPAFDEMDRRDASPLADEGDEMDRRPKRVTRRPARYR
jgi:hypothetical protein